MMINPKLYLISSGAAFLLLAFATSSCDSAGTDHGSGSPDIEGLINNALARVGTDDPQKGNCKEFVREVVASAIGVTIPSTNVPTGEIAWDDVDTSDSSTPVREMAQWLSTYVNAVTIPGTIEAGDTYPATASIPNADPQVVVIYSTNPAIVATLTNGSSVSISVTSTNGANGSVSSTLTGTAGDWTLTIMNTSQFVVDDVRVVVLSYARIESDWTTAIRGDMIQMHGKFPGSDATGPHSTFVLTDGQTGTNWVGANWPLGKVALVTTTLTEAICWFNVSDAEGFTVYRLN